MPDPNILHLLFQTLGIILATITLTKWLKKKFSPSPSHTPPGSPGLPLVGETLAFFAANRTSGGFYEFVRIRRSRYGSCFKTSMLGRTHVFVSTPDSARRVLCNYDGCFAKSYIRSISELLGKHSVLCATGEYHRHLRGRIGSLLSMERLSSFLTLFNELASDSLTTWWNGKVEVNEVVVFEEAIKITLRAMCGLLMGLRRDDEILETLQKDIMILCDGLLSFPVNIPFTRFSRGVKARKRITRALQMIIDERRTNPRESSDLLQDILMENTSPSCSNPITDAEIQDNILTLIIAGQITTASALAWMVKYLDENQHVQEKLREIHLTIAAEKSGSGIGLQTLNEMTYACKVVKETLRMATIVSWFPMIATKDCLIEGFRIKKGWIVNVDAKAIHRDDNLYEDPERFLPSRFDDQPSQCGFLAFGYGATTCLGKRLAKGMMAIFLHHLVTRYRWKVTDPDSSLQPGALFPRLRSGCRIRITPLES